MYAVGRLPDRQQLDRSVLTLTGIIWAAHLLTILSLSHALGVNTDAGATLARVLASSSGAAITLGIYTLLRSRETIPPWHPFVAAVVLSFPACAIQTFVNELAFHYFARSYQTDPAKWLDASEMGFTYLYFFWVFVAWSALYAGAANAAEILKRDRELAIAQSSAQEAQLLALRLQISPHFLFNTLNTLSGLAAMGRSQDSENIILNLSEFLRFTLDSTPSQLVRLSEEVRIQLIYLAIEKARFYDRLRVAIDIPTTCQFALVPSLILLPLVENAIKHGLAETEGEVLVSIGARIEGSDLLVWVANDGPGASSSARSGLSIGLRNVRERIVASFGPQANLSVGPTDTGWMSTITVPRLEHPA
jgi:two-component system LytT family sensor kinase